jgi:hypothetical protein
MSLHCDVHTVAGIYVPPSPCQNHYFTGSDIRRDLCIPANRDPAVRESNSALDLALDVQRFGTYYFPLDLQALALAALFMREIVESWSEFDMFKA